MYTFYSTFLFHGFYANIASFFFSFNDMELSRCNMYKKQLDKQTKKTTMLSKTTVPLFHVIARSYKQHRLYHQRPSEHWVD